MNPLVYKLIVDDNGAPCVTPELLSLAICKPGYRKNGKIGDVLFGFMGINATPDRTEPLVYIAKITDRVPILEYYTNPLYRNRPDCIYKYGEGEFEIRKVALYHNYRKGHPDRRDTDLGLKRDAFVLLSTEFRYLGGGSGFLISQYPELEKFVHGMGRTNYPKVIESVTVLKDCSQLFNSLWKQYPSSMKVGEAIHEPDTASCDDACGTNEC